MKTILIGTGVVAIGLIVSPLPDMILSGGDQENRSGSGYWNSIGKPDRILDGSRPINVTTGYAAPFVCDFNGDGLKDLLVGQFGEGKLRFYPNRGANSRPQFRGFEYVKAEGEDMTVPSG